MPDRPDLPINSKQSRGPAIEGIGGAGRRDRRQKTQTGDGNRARADSKAWADYTPTPFQGTPWNAMAQWGHGAFGPGMPPGYMVGHQEPDRPGDAQLPEHLRFPHASPTPGGPTPKVWPSTPTPTPGAQPSYGFGVPGMPGLPLQRPPTNMFNMMAEAAREAASAAAMAAHAAGSPNADDSQSPSRSPLEEGGGSSGPGALFNDDYAGEFDSPVIPGPGAMPPLFPAPVGPAGLGPSRGSHFHGTGKCRPCAWFHKPQGCQSAQSCSYCHLCPEGELKARKKTKVAAMRMGALTPANKQGKVGHGRDAGASGGGGPGARTLKLNPLL